jgi:hypothetical protein
MILFLVPVISREALPLSQYLSSIKAIVAFYSQYSRHKLIVSTKASTLYYMCNYASIVKTRKYLQVNIVY